MFVKLISALSAIVVTALTAASAAEAGGAAGSSVFAQTVGLLQGLGTAVSETVPLPVVAVLLAAISAGAARSRRAHW